MKTKVAELAIPSTRINQSGCLDRCEYGPVMVIYPEGVWYRPKSKEDIDAIIDSHFIQGKPVSRLLLPTS